MTKLDELAREYYAINANTDVLTVYKDAYRVALSGPEVADVADCAKELIEILSDRDARAEIDSFTIQPLQIALKQFERAKEDLK